MYNMARVLIQLGCLKASDTSVDRALKNRLAL